MKTLNDIKEHLPRAYNARIYGTLDSGEVIRIDIQECLNIYKDNSEIEVVFRDESGEELRIPDTTFQRLEKTLGDYKEWKIEPQDVAVWNFQRHIKEWVEVDEKTYWYSLESVPPAYHKNGVYACGEAYSYNAEGETAYRFFKEDNDGKFWTQIMSINDYLKSR